MRAIFGESFRTAQSSARRAIIRCLRRRFLRMYPLNIHFTDQVPLLIFSRRQKRQPPRRRKTYLSSPRTFSYIHKPLAYPATELDTTVVKGIYLGKVNLKIEPIA